MVVDAAIDVVVVGVEVVVVDAAIDVVVVGVEVVVVDAAIDVVVVGVEVVVVDAAIDVVVVGVEVVVVDAAIDVVVVGVEVVVVDAAIDVVVVGVEVVVVEAAIESCVGVEVVVVDAAIDVVVVETGIDVVAGAWMPVPRRERQGAGAVTRINVIASRPIHTLRAKRAGVVALRKATVCEPDTENTGERAVGRRAVETALHGAANRARPRARVEATGYRIQGEGAYPIGDERAAWQIEEQRRSSVPDGWDGVVTGPT